MTVDHTPNLWRGPRRQAATDCGETSWPRGYGRSPTHVSSATHRAPGRLSTSCGVRVWMLRPRSSLGLLQSICASIRSRKMPDSIQYDRPKVAPFLNDWREIALRRLVDNFAGFAASRVERQREYLWLQRARHLVRQITRASA